MHMWMLELTVPRTVCYKRPSGIRSSFSKASMHADWCYVALWTSNSFQMWLEVMCHPEYVCLLAGSFTDAPNKQMVGGGWGPRQEKKEWKKEMREENLTLKCLCCDYPLKNGNQHFAPHVKIQTSNAKNWRQVLWFK